MMFKTTFKRLIAAGTVVMLLFSQLAVAAYACPGNEGAARVVAAAADDAMQIAMPGCEMAAGAQGADGSNPNLCMQHCRAGEQSVQSLPHMPVPAFAATPALTVLEPVAVQSIVAAQFKSAWSVQVPLPPPLLRFGVLRI